MLCHNCQEKHANIQLRVNLNGNQKHLMLCEDCYQTEKEKLGASFGNPMSGFTGFGARLLTICSNSFQAILIIKTLTITRPLLLRKHLAEEMALSISTEEI